MRRGRGARGRRRRSARPRAGGRRYAEPPASALPAPDFSAELVDGTPVRGSELWDDRPSHARLHGELLRPLPRHPPRRREAVDAQDGAAGLLGVVGDDDAGGAEYAEELDLGYPVVVASERVWLSFAAREPGLVVLVAKGGKVVRGWPSAPSEAALADALDALIER